MKKTFYSLSFMAIFASGAFAQGITNGGFETWAGGEPTGWSTVNALVSGIGGSPNTTQETTIVHGGSSAAKLESVSALFATAPGIVAIANIDVFNQSVAPGASYAARPDSVGGYYRYTPSGTDAFYVLAILTKWNATSGQRDTVGVAEYQNTATVGSYTRFGAAFTYANTDTPDSLTMVISSSADLFAATPGSVAYVDDVAFVTNSGNASLSESVVAASVKVFPNPAKNIVNVSNLKVGEKIEIIDVTGKLIQSRTVRYTTETIDVTEFRSGLYFIKGKDFSKRLVISE